MESGPKDVIALKVEVGGLHHVGNPSLTEDGAKGLLHEAMEELEIRESRVTATKKCMIPIGHCNSNTWSQGESTACKVDNVGTCGSDNHQGLAAGQRSRQPGVRSLSVVSRNWRH